MWEHDPRLKGQPELAGCSAGLYVCSQLAGADLTDCLGTEDAERDLIGRVTEKRGKSNSLYYIHKI